MLDCLAGIISLLTCFHLQSESIVTGVIVTQIDEDGTFELGFTGDSSGVPLSSLSTSPSCMRIGEKQPAGGSCRTAKNAITHSDRVMMCGIGAGKVAMEGLAVDIATESVLAKSSIVPEALGGTLFSKMSSHAENIPQADATRRKLAM